MELQNIDVTSLEQLREYAKGDLVQLPPFSENMPFVARLKRPSLMKLVKLGKIPNSLLYKANELFKKGVSGLDEEDDNMLKEALGVLEVFAEASLVSPTYKQIKEIGLELTDEQLSFIFSYGQAGVRALESFRTKQTSRNYISNEQEVQ